MTNYFLVICTIFTKGMLFVVFLITIKPKGNLKKKINARSYIRVRSMRTRSCSKGSYVHHNGCIQVEYKL